MNADPGKHSFHWVTSFRLGSGTKNWAESAYRAVQRIQLELRRLKFAHKVKRLKTGSRRGPGGKTSTQVTVCVTVVEAEERKKKDMDSHEKKEMQIIVFKEKK